MFSDYKLYIHPHKKYSHIGTNFTLRIVQDYVHEPMDGIINRPIWDFTVCPRGKGCTACIVHSLSLLLLFARSVLRYLHIFIVYFYFRNEQGSE